MLRKNFSYFSPPPKENWLLLRPYWLPSPKRPHNLESFFQPFNVKLKNFGLCNKSRLELEGCNIDGSYVAFDWPSVFAT